MKILEILKEFVDIPIGRKGRATVKAPTMLYHSLRGKELAPDGSIKGYPLRPKEAELADMFPEQVNDEFVWLSQSPNYGGESLMIDARQLDLMKLRFTGQSEGFLIFHGSIPAKAIVKHPK